MTTVTAILLLGRLTLCHVSNIPVGHIGIFDGFMTMKIKLVRLLTLIIAVMGLAACSGTSAYMANFPQMVGIEGVTVVGTGKTIGDHIISFATGKNCSTVRKNTGKHYCEEDEVAMPEEVYCYNTLGEVSCYGEPRPYGQSQVHLGQKPNRMGLVR